MRLPRHALDWTLTALRRGESFPASVPGSVQLDVAAARG